MTKDCELCLPVLFVDGCQGVMWLLGWSKEFLLCRYSSGSPSMCIFGSGFYRLAGGNGASGHSKVTAHVIKITKSNGALAV